MKKMGRVKKNYKKKLLRDVELGNLGLITRRHHNKTSTSRIKRGKSVILINILKRELIQS